MTFILTLGNAEQFIQLSDRRLTVGETVFDNGYDKAIIINTPSGRFTLGFTGIAKYKLFNTREWLRKTISHILDNNAGNMRQLPAELGDRLTREFESNADLQSLSRIQRRLTVILSGYLDDANPPALALSFISNYQDFIKGYDQTESDSSFSVFYDSENANPRLENPIMVQRIGFWRLMTSRDLQAIQNGLRLQIPRKNLIDLGVGVIRRMSEVSKNTIGKDIMCVTIPRMLKENPICELYNFQQSPEIFIADSILSNGQKTFEIFNAKISFAPVGSEKPMFPSNIPRNAKCPCGNGKKYKKCHGFDR